MPVLAESIAGELGGVFVDEVTMRHDLGRSPARWARQTPASYGALARATASSTSAPQSVNSVICLGHRVDDRDDVPMPGALANFLQDRVRQRSSPS